MATVFILQLTILLHKCLCTDMVTFLEEISRRWLSAKCMSNVFSGKALGCGIQASVALSPCSSTY